jgi:hypothetical protein
LPGMFCISFTIGRGAFSILRVTRLFVCFAAQLFRDGFLERLHVICHREFCLTGAILFSDSHFSSSATEFLQRSYFSPFCVRSIV